MHNLKAKIDDHVIDMRTLTDDDINFIKSRTEIITLDGVPSSEDELKKGVLYGYDLPEAPVADADVIVLPDKPTQDNDLTKGRLHLYKSDIDPNAVNVKLYDTEQNESVVGNNEVIFHQLNENVLGHNLLED